MECFERSNIPDVLEITASKTSLSLDLTGTFTTYHLIVSFNSLFDTSNTILLPMRAAIQTAKYATESYSMLEYGLDSAKARGHACHEAIDEEDKNHGRDVDDK
jgi:hypothetical protein